MFQAQIIHLVQQKKKYGTHNCAMMEKDTTITILPSSLQHYPFW